MIDENDPLYKEVIEKAFPFLIKEEIEKYKTNINIVNKSENENPKYESSEAAGFDFRANLTEPIVLNSLDRALISTGLFFDIPSGFELQVRPRSGLAAKNGITVLNSPGTVDSDYTGEVKIILVNLSNEPFTINNGDRIAQGVFATVSNNKILRFNFVEELNKITERSEGGFGSTGIK